uniref:Guanylate cyclase n=1 Tax=Panagrellus redivivus TaxID=6233 RepID=A0A7E4ZQL5_PANRE
MQIWTFRSITLQWCDQGPNESASIIDYPLPTPNVPSTSDPVAIFIANTLPLEFKKFVQLRNDAAAKSALVDERFGTPLYHGFNAASNVIYFVENALTHVRLLNSTTSLALRSDVCAVTGFPIRRRIVSVFHELNLPFDVECFSCDSSMIGHRHPKFFRILEQRNALTQNLVSEATPLAEYLKMSTNESGMHHLLQGQLWQSGDYADGRLQWLPELLSEDPEDPIVAPTYVYRNGMSFVCTTESNGAQKSTEIVVNVDTLVPAPPDVTAILNGSYIGEISKRRFQIGDLTPYDQNVHGRALPIVNEKLNLKLNISWEPWSCCSACCCSEVTCGRGFATSDAACRATVSDQTRRGFVSLFKVELTKPIDIMPSLKAHYRGIVSAEFSLPDIAEAAAELDAYLTFEPYSTSGIPVFSTFWHRSPAWLLIENFFNSEFRYRNPHKTKIGPLGMFIDVKSCDNLQQKHDCNVLQACLDGQDASDALAAPFLNGGRTSKGSNTGSNNGQKPKNDPRERQEECMFRGIEEVTIRELESAVPVDDGFSYAFIIDESEFGELISASWSVKGDPVAAFEPGQPCSEQRLFTDGFALTLIKVTSEDCMMPYVARGIVKATGEEIRLRLTLTFKTKQKASKYSGALIKWGLIAGGILTLFVIGVIIIHCIQVRSLKRKLAQAKANNNTGNSTSKLIKHNAQ